jgi:ATP-binding cassette subfamily B protein
MLLKRKKEKVETYNKTSYVLKNLWKYLYKHKVIILIAAFFTISSNLISLLGPKVIGEAVKVMVGKGQVDFTTLYKYVLYLVVIYIVGAVLSYLLRIIMVRITQNMIYEIRRDLFNKIVNLPLRYFDKNQKGDLLSKMSYDVDTLAESISSDVISIISSIVTVTGAFIMMITISLPLMLIFVVIVPTTFIFSSRITKKTRKLFRIRVKNIGKMNAYIEEMLTGQKTIKAYHQEQTTIDNFMKVNKEAVDSTYEAQYYSSIVMPTVNFFTNLSLALSAVFGTILMINGYIGIDGITSFVLYSRKFSGPINEMMGLISDIQSALSAGERVFRTINENAENLIDSSKIDEVAKYGNVDIEHVNFGYEKDQLIIKDFNLNVKQGSLVAIVGPTGAGKTTIVNLLMRFYDIDSGTIRLDNIDYNDLSLNSTRKSYAMVLQETWLFGGSIYDNIKYGNENDSLEEVMRVSKLVRADQFISKLENGYDTIINDNGTNISAGEKQLITIARAMLSDARILILDEATSNVDTRSEVLIQDAMKELMKNRTSFVIAHRLSTIKNADIILVVDKGQIVEQGNHEELLAKQGFYYRLYNSQFEKS